MIAALLLTLVASPPAERGMALGLFSTDPKYRYEGLLDEIAATGSTHVSIAWVWWQDDLSASTIKSVPGWSATDAQITASITHAKKLGLKVMAFPILRLIETKKRDEWRGRIAPADEDAWWKSYGEMIGRAARLAKEGGADRLCVGSELVSREHMRARWKELIEGLRLEAPQLELIYSANWDHFREVSFWDLVDVVGLTAYFELTRSNDATSAELSLAWMGIKSLLAEFSGKVGRKIVLTELGYPSIDGAAAYPWDETRATAIDLEEQRRAYEAFVASWSGAPHLEGVYFWNWFGHGGPTDRSYSPRKKPAEAIIRAWYRPRAL